MSQMFEQKWMIEELIKKVIYAIRKQFDKGIF
jgi:hypothetical protein